MTCTSKIPKRLSLLIYIEFFLISFLFCKGLGSVLDTTRLAQLPHFLNLQPAGSFNNETGDISLHENNLKPSPSPSDIIPDCESFLIEFSKRSGDFIRCSVVNARPFRFCERCADEYMKVTRVYDDIKQNENNHDDCVSVLLNSDRVQIINSIRNSIKDIWDRADCKECFSVLSEDENGTVTKDLTANAKQFLVLYANYTRCIPENVTMGREGYIHNDTVCQDCQQYYRDMNTLFTTMRVDENSPHPVCMDLVDMMNYTRLMWGKTLGCTVRHRDYVPVVLITFVLFLIPIAFYVGLAVYGTKQHRKLLAEKRLSKMTILNSNNYGSIDSSPRLPLSPDNSISISPPHSYTNSLLDSGNLQHRQASERINQNHIHS